METVVGKKRIVVEKGIRVENKCAILTTFTGSFTGIFTGIFSPSFFLYRSPNSIKFYNIF